MICIFISDLGYRVAVEDTFRIDTVIDESCKKLSAEIAEKQLSLHVSLVPIEVAANQLLIGQVIVNFINNAIHYTPEGNSIHISMNEEQESVKVCIENTGVHIPSEQIEKIWDRFYRGEASRHRSTGGTGLGLAISKKILELHEVPYGATIQRTVFSSFSTSGKAIPQQLLNKPNRFRFVTQEQFLPTSRTCSYFYFNSISSAFYLHLSTLNYPM